MSDAEDKIMIWPAGMFRLTTKRIDPQKVLVGALKHGLSEVLVLGIDVDGEHFAASSCGDPAKVQALMDAFVAARDAGDYIGY